jgi:hypothetical protein
MNKRLPACMVGKVDTPAASAIALANSSSNDFDGEQGNSNEEGKHNGAKRHGRLSCNGASDSVEPESRGSIRLAGTGWPAKPLISNDLPPSDGGRQLDLSLVRQ